MANTQINITANGTKTLATAGKYCDRNIDVNVSVPSSGITPTGNKNITTNGTHDVTQYANAVVNVPVPSGYVKPSGSKTITENGTYDIANYASAVVSVSGGQATQFTNLYDPANVMVKKVVNASSAGITYGDDNYCNVVKVPFHHVKGEPVVMRIRGIGTVRDRIGCGVLAADGETRVNHYQITNTSYFELSYDEHGDAVITFKGSLISNYEWYYFVFGFQYTGINSGVTTPYTGPIITINEPIGNGGHI